MKEDSPLLTHLLPSGPLTSPAYRYTESSTSLTLYPVLQLNNGPSRSPRIPAGPA